MFFIPLQIKLYVFKTKNWIGITNGYLGDKKRGNLLVWKLMAWKLFSIIFMIVSSMRKYGFRRDYFREEKEFGNKYESKNSSIVRLHSGGNNMQKGLKLFLKSLGTGSKKTKNYLLLMWSHSWIWISTIHYIKPLMYKILCNQVVKIWKGLIL